MVHKPDSVTHRHWCKAPRWTTPSRRWQQHQQPADPESSGCERRSLSSAAELLPGHWWSRSPAPSTEARKSQQSMSVNLHKKLQITRQAVYKIIGKQNFELTVDISDSLSSVFDDVGLPPPCSLTTARMLSVISFSCCTTFNLATPKENKCSVSL